MMTYLWVALGGALGSVARFALAGIVGRQLGESFPWGTLFVNVTGSFAIGFFSALVSPGGRWFAHETTVRTILMAGVCGGYTTFSAFSLQTLNLFEDGKWLHAGVNIVFSVIACLAAVWLGHLLAMSFNTMKGS